MSWFSGITQFLSRSSAAKSASKPNPTVKITQDNFNPSQIKVLKQSQASTVYLTKSAMSNDQPLSRDDHNLINKDIATYCTGSDTLLGTIL